MSNLISEQVVAPVLEAVLEAVSVCSSGAAVTVCAARFSLGSTMAGGGRAS